MIIRTLRDKPGCPFFVIRNFGTLGLVVDILTYEEKKARIMPILYGLC